MTIRRPLKHAWLALAALVALVFSSAGSAQQKVPFRNNIPVAPQGIKVPPLPDKPVDFHTAEGQDIRVAVVARGLSHPWAGTTNFDTLLPNAVAAISFRNYEIPGQAKRIRLVFQYFYDAGPLTRGASHIVTNLPLGKLSPDVRYRLYQQGLLSGQGQRSYDGNWVSNRVAGRIALPAPTPPAIENGTCLARCRFLN